MTAGEIDPSWGIVLHEPDEVDRTHIPMRDGTKLYLEVFRPDGEGPFPTILIRNPYHNVSIPPSTRGKDTHKEFVTRGYAVVEAEVRGTGISEGKFSFLINDGQDGYDTVLWILDQPWCNGNIGTMGSSYLGMDQLVLAAQDPPGLKAMFVGYAGADIYREAFYTGGIMNMLMVRWSITHLAHRVAPNVPRLGRMPEERDKRIHQMQEMIHGQRIRTAVERIVAGRGLFDNDFLDEWVENETDGPFWRAQSPKTGFPKIKTPIYCYGGWFDFFIRGTISSFMGIDAPKKLIIGPWFHGGREGFDLIRTQLRWFDYWLKGWDNGIMDEPPVRVYVVGRDRWIFQPGWPPETTEAKYFLGSGANQVPHPEDDGVLRGKPPEAESPDAIAHDPENPVPTVSQRKGDIRRAEKSMLSYTTERLEAELEVAGSPVLHLFGSTDHEDVDWVAKLTEVGPEGESIMFTMGRLRGSHCRSHSEPENLEPGRVYHFELELMPIWKVFPSGSQVRIDIANSDFPDTYPNPVQSSNLVYHDSEYPSHLVLPVKM